MFSLKGSKKVFFGFALISVLYFPQIRSHEILINEIIAAESQTKPNTQPPPSHSNVPTTPIIPSVASPTSPSVTTPQNSDGSGSYNDHLYESYPSKGK